MRSVSWGCVRACEVFEKVGESGVVHVEVCYGGVFALWFVSLVARGEVLEGIPFWRSIKSGIVECISRDRLEYSVEQSELIK